MLVSAVHKFPTEQLAQGRYFNETSISFSTVQLNQQRNEAREGDSSPAPPSPSPNKSTQQRRPG